MNDGRSPENQDSRSWFNRLAGVISGEAGNKVELIDELRDAKDRGLFNQETLAILEGVIGLATAFHRTAIAEGVETVEHGEALLQMGCELAQGFGIAHPMSADQMPDWSAAWRSPPAWANCPPLSHDNILLLRAVVEHRAWIVAAENFIKGERAAPPPLDPHNCRFGLRLDAERQSGRDTQPGLIAIETLHQQVHTLVDELCNLRSDGRATESVARLGALFSLRDALLGQMKVLETSRNGRIRLSSDNAAIGPRSRRQGR